MTLYIDNKIDLLAILENGRELNSPVDHFICIGIENHNIKLAKDWIWKNLKGRFVIHTTSACFEIPSEASMFALIKDQFKFDHGQ